MQRVEENVNDIVSVRAFSNVSDLSADPVHTLAGYHFTDITADLMAKWLDSVIAVRKGQGAAIALAGFRGVGKSHFLAVLAAVVSIPEVRTGITDQHVATSAERFSRRHAPIAFVRRGSCDTLLDEIKEAVASLTSQKKGDLSDSVKDLLLLASEAGGEVPLVLVIDTSHGRQFRVSRDDGPLLSEIAEQAKAIGIFVGLALDDDIAGADGANLSISSSYTIDFLDQEHLYKIVDTHIFRKKESSLALLHNLYKKFSDRLSAFRWSEQRFMSLYPLHPVTFEIASLIRLYLQDFSILGFLSDAGDEMLDRPANSLIGLGEVFDAVEVQLRAVGQLDEAFAAFDLLDHDIVGKTPVDHRLWASLVLKGLFMLSLDGIGPTASGIAAAMLLTDDREDSLSCADISRLLESFVTSMPDSVSRTERDSAESVYCFRLSSKDELNTRLDDAIKNVPEEAVAAILLRQTSEKYSDLNFPEDQEKYVTPCGVEWRGAIRHGEIRWSLNSSNVEEAHTRSFDWTVSLSFAKATSANDDIGIKWRIEQLQADELDTIRRLHVLQTDAKLREEFKEKVSAANHIQSLAVEKIWHRIFLSDSRLIVGKAEYQFTDEARTAHTLSQLFTIMLAPVFEGRFPAHPNFAQPLGVKEAANLTGQFFGGAGQNNSDIQKLAETFGLPLGLVEMQDDVFVAVPAEVLMHLPIVRSALDGLDFTTDTAVTISDLSSRMGAEPAGLTHEAQHLVLAALVAQRQFEFVTFSGNRINHRSLDLQIIWEDIAGIAKPRVEVYSSERLLFWAALITGNEQVNSLERSEDRLLVIERLSGWLANWKEAQFLETFESLPDENLNSSIWRIAANLKKTFGALVESIEALLQNMIPLDQCLHNIADLFSDSEEEYDKKKKDLILLRYFTQGAAKRDEISAYLALCETTDDDEMEALRRSLLDRTGSGYFANEPSANTGIEELWENFKERYADHYVEKHDAVMNSQSSGKKMNEIFCSDRWRAFEDLSDLPWFDPHFASGAQTIIRKIRILECKSDVRELLASKPFCNCSFTLARFERRKDQASRLETLINQGLLYFRSSLNQNASELMAAFDSDNNETTASLKQRLSEWTDTNGIPNLSTREVELLRTAVASVEKKRADSRKKRKPAFEDFSDLLPDEVREWEDEIANLQIFANPRP